MVRGRAGGKYRPVHMRMIETPMTTVGLGRDEPLTLKFAPGLLHLIACRQVKSPWQATDGVQPNAIATRG